MKPLGVLLYLTFGTAACLYLAHRYEELPYFPIDITVGCSGEVASKAFAFLAITSWLCYDWTMYSTWVTLSWFGFTLLAVIPFTVSIVLHQLGFLLVMIGFYMLCSEKRQGWPMLFLTVCGTIVCYLWRFSTVMRRDFVRHVSLEQFLDEWNMIRFIYDRCLDVTLGQGAKPNPETLFVFQTTSVLLWFVWFLTTFTLLSLGYCPRETTNPIPRDQQRRL